MFSASAQLSASVYSFETAEAFLDAPGPKGRLNSRRIANNTYVERRDEFPDRITIRLHQTDIITYTRSGLVTFYSGGFLTQLTKQRINLFLPDTWSLVSNRGWRLQNRVLGIDVAYRDGITLRQNPGSAWTLQDGTYPTEDEEKQLAVATRKVDRAIKDYVAKYDEKYAAWAEELSESGSLSLNGDPFCCRGLLGAEDNSHLWLHIEEGYCFPTLLLKAFEFRNYPDPKRALAMWLIGRDRKGLKENLTKYLRAQLRPTGVQVQHGRKPIGATKLDYYAEQAKAALQKPEDFGYFGGDTNLWKYSAPTWAKHRDSSNSEIANFDVVWEGLKERFPDLFREGLDEEGYVDRNFDAWPSIYIFGAGHWAVGHIDQIVVPVVENPARPVGPSNLHPAFIAVMEYVDMQNAYPVLPGAEEKTAELDNADVINDIKGWLEYWDRQDETELWSANLDWLVAHYTVENDVESYHWDSDELRDEIVTQAAYAAYEENNQQIDGQQELEIT